MKTELDWSLPWHALQRSLADTFDGAAARHTIRPDATAWMARPVPGATTWIARARMTSFPGCHRWGRSHAVGRSHALGPTE